MPYKRGNKYVAQVRRNGKRKEKTFKTRKEAVAWEVKMREEAEAGWPSETHTVSLLEWASKYMSYAEKHFVGKVYAEKRLAFRLFFKKIDPHLPVDALTRQMVLEHLQEQMEKRSGYAANKDRKNLVAAWNWGVDYLNLPPVNPCAVAKMPEERHPRYVPPLEDFWKVFRCADDIQDKTMLLTFLHTAGRRGEIFRLKISDLDFDNQRIRLWTRKRKGGNFEFDWLPMTAELERHLKEWLAVRPEVGNDHVFICLDRTEFCREYYGQPFRYRLHMMRRLCEKAQVKPFGFHAIRHLTAQQLYEKHGYEVAIIQAILRHKSPNTTSRYLKKIGLKGVRKALDALSLDNMPQAAPM